ncbi:MAG: hypothetical protein IK114_03505 [Fibrobacter sp.]|nr:hypothetical protein [Fibrobacter sp.]
MNIKPINYLVWKKLDPTEYDVKTDSINVRSNYDVQKDPDGWIVHEKIHAYLASVHFEDNYNPPLVEYPFNDVERYAFTWQFVFLLETKRIDSISDIEKIMPWKFEKFGDKWANLYFQLARERYINDDPSSHPKMIIQGGAMHPWKDIQLEEMFREIVDNAKQNFSLINLDEDRKSALKENDTSDKGCIKIAIIIAIILISIAVYCTL